MVLTGGVGITDSYPGRGPSRRRLLRSAALGVAGTTTLAGCGLFGDDPEPAPPPDPLAPMLAEALTLAAAYDRAIVGQPDLRARLTPLADAHRAHATELARVIGPTASGATASGVTASGGPSGSPDAGADPGASLTGLRRAEQAAQRTAVTLCRQAPANRAALVGSIAAARAGHAEALR